MSESDVPQAAPPAERRRQVAKRTLKERLAAHFAEYGKVALYTYLALSLLTIAGFSIAIGIGIQPDKASGFFGVIAAGWLAAKATMPIRILLTFGLTPPIAWVVRRKDRKAGAEVPSAEPPAIPE